MKLKLLDRVTIGNVLPKEDSFDQLVIADSIQEKTKITKDDIKTYGMITNSAGGIGWNKIGEEIRFDIEFDELEQALVKKQLEKLDSEKRLSSDAIGLYRAFVTKTEAKAESKPAK